MQPAIWYYHSHVVDAHDVICGQKCEKHPGNTRFRKIVTEYKTLYQTTSTRETKKQIIETVIQRVTDSSGRFIKESDDKMSMEVVSPQYVYVKVSHALRSSRLSMQQAALLVLLPPDETATGTEGQPQLSSGAVFDNLLATQQRLFYSSVSGSAACSDSDDGDDDDNVE
jgi:hypothetical protein